MQKNQKVQDVFEEVKREEPINVENFFIDDNDVFESEGISNADREFIIDFITEQILLPILKDSLKNQMRQKWKLFILREKKVEKKEQMSIDVVEKPTPFALRNR